MESQFFERPILNSPYAYPARHWELDAEGQPTGQIVEARRGAQFITPVPKPRKRKRKAGQEVLVFDEGAGWPLVLGAAIRAREAHQPVELLTPHRAHDFIHASDVAMAISCALRSDLRGEFDIGSGVTRPVSKLVERAGATWSQAPGGATESSAGTAADIRDLRRINWTPKRTEEFFSHA